MVRLGGFGGSVWVMGEWPVGQWIVGVISFQKMYGFYGLKYHIVDISRDVMRDVRTSEYSATQLLICEKLSLWALAPGSRTRGMETNVQPQRFKVQLCV